MDEQFFETVYPPVIRNQIRDKIDLIAPRQSVATIRDNPTALRDLTLLFTGWSAPKLDAEFLSCVPNLQVVFYGAGSIKSIISDEFWKHDIQITHAAVANAVPVAQFTLSQILYCLKGGWYYSRHTRSTKQFAKRRLFAGLSDSTVGVIGLGHIGRYVCELLQPFDINIIAYDPYATQDSVDSFNVKLVDLDTLLKEADVISLHTPWLPETEGMVRGEHFLTMKHNSSFINTARGALVREDEMIHALQQRADITAVLDVTYPEPPHHNSLLYTLDNIVLTPHIAGATDPGDLKRMGQTMLGELLRYLRDEPLKWRVSKAQIDQMA